MTSDLSQDTRGLPAQRGGYLSFAQISLRLAPALTLSDFLFLAVSDKRVKGRVTLSSQSDLRALKEKYEATPPPHSR